MYFVIRGVPHSFINNCLSRVVFFAKQKILLGLDSLDRRNGDRTGIVFRWGECYRQAWNSIYASFRGRSALSGTIIGADPLSMNVRSKVTGQVERRTMYCVVVLVYRVPVYIPATEMWMGEARPDYVVAFHNAVQFIAGAVLLPQISDGGVAQFPLGHSASFSRPAAWGRAATAPF